MVEIETGRRVPMWRTFVFAIGKCYISAAMPFIVAFIVINSSSLFICMQQLCDVEKVAVFCPVQLFTISVVVVFIHHVDGLPEKQLCVNNNIAVEYIYTKTTLQCTHKLNRRNKKKTYSVSI